MTDRIAPHILDITPLKALPALPKLLNTTRMPLIAPDIKLPAVDTAVLILLQALLSMPLNDPPALPKFVKYPITVPTHSATVVNAGTQALNASTNHVITGVKNPIALVIMSNVAETPIRIPLKTPPKNAPTTCKTGISALANTVTIG